ncbi:MAG TPA: hypothetical protein VJK48_03045 [Chlamydiales bacterium]|nr:hypothetical protein [Chlamydiales bacterium]
MGFCIATLSFCLYSYLAAQNDLTGLKMELPTVEKEISLVREENRRLSYEVEQFQSPANLIEKARAPEFSHLKHPLLKEIVTVPEALATN